MPWRTDDGQGEHLLEVKTWKPITYYWPFVRGIHRSPVGYPQKGTAIWGAAFPVISLNKLLNKTVDRRWFDTPWRSCVTVYNGCFDTAITALNRRKERHPSGHTGTTTHEPYYLLPRSDNLLAPVLQVSDGGFVVALSYISPSYVWKQWRAIASCENLKCAISPRWLKSGAVCHPDDILNLP